MSLKLKHAAPLYVGTPEWMEDILSEVSIDRRDAGLDHPRHYKNIFVVQPYAAQGDSLLKFLLLCSQHKLTVKVSGISNYWPSHTFTIVVYRPQDEAEYMEYWSKNQTTSIIVPDGEDRFDGGGN